MIWLSVQFAFTLGYPSRSSGQRRHGAAHRAGYVLKLISSIFKTGFNRGLPASTKSLRNQVFIHNKTSPRIIRAGFVKHKSALEASILAAEKPGAKFQSTELKPVEYLIRPESFKPL